MWKSFFYLAGGTEKKQKACLYENMEGADDARADVRHGLIHLSQLHTGRCPAPEVVLHPATNRPIAKCCVHCYEQETCGIALGLCQA